MKNLDFNEIHNMNCIEGVKQIPDDSVVGLVITDPPFAIEFMAKRNNYNRKAARDFRNSDGSPRKEKVLLDLEKIDRELRYFSEF